MQVFSQTCFSLFGSSPAQSSHSVKANIPTQILLDFVSSVMSSRQFFWFAPMLLKQQSRVRRLRHMDDSAVTVYERNTTSLSICCADSDVFQSEQTAIVNSTRHVEAHNEQEQQKAQQAALEAQAQVLILRKHGIENTFKAKDGQRSKFFFFFFSGVVCDGPFRPYQPLLQHQPQQH